MLSLREITTETDTFVTKGVTYINYIEMFQIEIFKPNNIHLCLSWAYVYELVYHSRSLIYSTFIRR